MSDETTKIMGLMPNYSSFIASAMNLIYQIFLTGTASEQMDAVWKLIPFLPNEVRDELKPMLDEVEKELNSVYMIKGAEYHQTSVDRQIAQGAVGYKWARKLMIEISTLLSSRGYMEKLGAQPRAKGDGRLKIE